MGCMGLRSAKGRRPMKNNDVFHHEYIDPKAIVMAPWKEHVLTTLNQAAMESLMLKDAKRVLIEAPRFAMTKEVTDLLYEGDGKKTVFDIMEMCKAGIVHLPFREVII